MLIDISCLTEIERDLLLSFLDGQKIKILHGKNAIKYVISLQIVSEEKVAYFYTTVEGDIHCDSLLELIELLTKN